MQNFPDITILNRVVRVKRVVMMVRLVNDQYGKVVLIELKS